MTPLSAEEASIYLEHSLPTSFTSLLRSHSINSARRQSPLVEVDESDKVAFSEHDHSLSEYPTVSMLEAPLDRQSSAKRTRSRFYSMFNRSTRSRSNSRSDPPPAYDFPEDHRTLPIEHSKLPSSSSDKSISRPKSPSLPHSHGASASQTLPTAAKAMHSAGAGSTVEHSTSPSRPTTPKARTKISNIFGLISSPKKTSRPTSPNGFHDPGPSISLTYRAQSPTMTLEMKASAPGPSKHDFFRPLRRTSMEVPSPYTAGAKGTGPHSYHDLPRYPSLSDDTPEHSVVRKLSRRSSRGKSAASSTEQIVHAPSPQKIPQIIHTPPTPQRPSTSPGRLHQRKNSTGSQHHSPQPQILNTVTEERLSMLECSPVDTPRTEKGKERDTFDRTLSSYHQPPTHGALHRKAGTTGAVKERKHGSFNFERPSRASASQDGHLPRLLSSSGEPSTSSSHRHRSLVPPPTPPDAHPTVSASSSQQSHSQTHSHSTHRTNHTSSTGQRDSSWGRMFGRKSKAAKAPKPTPSPPKAHRVTHGQFDFEPAVPSPRSFAFSREDAEGVATRLRAAQRERDRDRARVKEKERERELERERQLLAQARRAVEVSQLLSSSGSGPSDRPVGFRSGNKGKSLDLGLGLSWAPTKMREDALLPSFSRSMPGSGSSRNGYRNSRERDVLYVDEHGALRHRSPNVSKVGRDVAEVFKQALTEGDFMLFKKYVHRFDAHEIPFDGPTGIVSRVEKLLQHAPALSDAGKQDLLDSFIRIVLQNA
ncbi:hypothetical protein BDV98DRAFT_589378 [Pterulicium gracile]|uniref:Uncharacterized protein n=1 Tax=Pterulicium gracile TaxID=1884261 RepID=A0A5C3QZ41_9AGAR|nr:hypothetical protein BDV98DRAFT_589378 [Pterula gracilis]